MIRRQKFYQIVEGANDCKKQFFAYYRNLESAKVAYDNVKENNCMIQGYDSEILLYEINVYSYNVVNSKILKAHKKYELTKETKEFEGVILHRIKAARNFSNIEKGTLGGWVENQDNLSHAGNSWVSDEAVVCGEAQVFENAIVKNHAVVKDKSKVYGNGLV